MIEQIHTCTSNSRFWIIYFIYTQFTQTSRQTTNIQCCHVRSIGVRMCLTAVPFSFNNFIFYFYVEYFIASTLKIWEKSKKNMIIFNLFQFLNWIFGYFCHQFHFKILNFLSNVFFSYTKCVHEVASSRHFDAVYVKCATHIMYYMYCVSVQYIKLSTRITY